MPEHVEEKKPLLSNETYDLLQKIVKLVLPGLGALYFALAAIWDLPYSEQVVGTLAALAVFGGVLLQISNRSYENSTEAKDGVITISSDPGGVEYTGQTLPPPEDLVGKKNITLKVNSQ